MDVKQQQKHQASKNVALVGLLLLYTASFPSHAVYEVDKVRMFLSLTRPVDTLKLSNPSTDKPVNLQAQLFSWTQKMGKMNTYLLTT